METSHLLNVGRNAFFFFYYVKNSWFVLCGFCMMTLTFCFYLGMVLQHNELMCFCYHADASLCLGLSELSQIIVQMSALYLCSNVELTRDIA